VYEPAAHDKQLELSETAEYLPTGQGMQPVLVLYDPGPQIVVVHDDEPVVAVEKPDGQSVQVEAPITDANLFTAQNVQRLMPTEAEKRPGEHGEQTVAPEILNVPAGHFMHVLLPVLDMTE